MRDAKEATVLTPRPPGSKDTAAIGRGSRPASDVINSSVIRRLRNTVDLAANTTMYVGIIDQYVFTRECIGNSLQAASGDIAVQSFATFEEALRAKTSFDVLLYFCHKHAASGSTRDLEEFSIENCKDLAPVILLSVADHQDFIIDKFRRGARGYIPIENTSIRLLIEIIRLIKVGGTYIPAISLPLKTGIRDRYDAEPPDHRFTIREKAVLDLLKVGNANKVIAHQLSMSESTVKAHIRSIMRKLSARNRTEAVSLALAADAATLATAPANHTSSPSPIDCRATSQCAPGAANGQRKPSSAGQRLRHKPNPRAGTAISSAKSS